MLTIGLTGGIGSGKSTVAKMLADLGARVLDADKVGHAIYEPGGPCYRDVLAAFGDAVLAPDRTIDRRKLGPIVFADPGALKRLNSIVHPRMFERMREMVTAMRAEGEKNPIVIEAAILIEANWQPLCDEVWLVVASRERVIERVERDRGMKPEQTEARIRAQLSDEERRRHATLVIENNGSVDDLRTKLTSLWSAALARNRAKGDA
ncbi:MAG TPA: dephospho-CoA kinase [Candidatus Binataceae bacterium]|nr:dephospho-CoA kinase [Candidatus Binataceae bacterium]